jgi:hypothetical protein
VKVLHAPVVDPPLTDYVQARAGEEVEVTCVVHAYPPPTVAWYRNGGLLAAQETVTAVRGERYTLIATPIGIFVHYCKVMIFREKYVFRIPKKSKTSSDG